MAAASDGSSADGLPSIRIALVDDHPALLMGLSALLRDAGGYEIAGTASGAEDAVALAASSRPDIMLLDLSMPGDVFSAMQHVRVQSPDTQIIVFTAYAEVGLARRAMDCGASGFVLKGSAVEELHRAIAAAREGETFISAELLPGLDGESKKGGALPLPLSARETQLLQCLLKAMSNKEIARALDLTEKTVKHYMTNLMAKLGARNRLDAVLAARRLGLVTDQPGEGLGSLQAPEA